MVVWGGGCYFGITVLPTYKISFRTLKKKTDYKIISFNSAILRFFAHLDMERRKRKKEKDNSIGLDITRLPANLSINSSTKKPGREVNSCYR